jgi:hypothetical protein
MAVDPVTGEPRTRYRLSIITGKEIGQGIRNQLEIEILPAASGP